jgi:hypothetical protein
VHVLPIAAAEVDADLTCTSATATLKKGSGQTSPIGEDHIGDVQQLHGPGQLVFHRDDLRVDCSPMEAERHNIRDRRYHGDVTGVTASISGSGCTASVAGTTATVQGRVASKYQLHPHPEGQRRQPAHLQRQQRLPRPDQHR